MTPCASATAWHRMHPRSDGSYSPSSKFSIQRSYLHWLAFNIVGYAVTNVANVYTWIWSVDPCVTHTIIFNPNFYAWSSNHYSLDYVVDDYYYQLTCSGAKTRPGFSIYYYPNSLRTGLALEFRYVGVDFGSHVYMPLPPQIGTYWVPPPL